MIVAFLKSKVDALNEREQEALELSPIWVRYGEPAIWQARTGNKEWYVSSDPRITPEDVARSAAILATPNKVKVKEGKPEKDKTPQEKTEKDRRERAALVHAEIDFIDWDRGVVGTETVETTVMERVIESYDQVSIGMFCIESDGDGECVTWEERFKQVPVYEQEEARDEKGKLIKDEDGKQVWVDHLHEVTYETTVDVYLSPQDVAEAQGPQVKNWVLAGARVREDLEPVEEIDVP